MMMCCGDDVVMVICTVHLLLAAFPYVTFVIINSNDVLIRRIDEC